MTQKHNMKRRRRQCGQLCLLLTGILFIFSGIGIFIYMEPIYEYIIKDALKFTPSSDSYKAWMTNDPPLIMNIYLFNWTNPEQVRNLSVKPEFVEVGPYRFKEIKEKVNITWHQNETVSFKTRRMYYFDKEHSVRNLSDIISTINVVPLTVGYQSRNYGFWSKRLISMGLSSVSSLYVTKTASEILFEGYEEPILSTLSNFPMLDVADRFGIFYGRNNTIGKDGHYSMSYSTDESFGRILTWNHKNTTNFFEGHCNDIKGSNGEFYPINRKRDKILMYSSELCKYAELEFARDVELKGVHGYRYTGDNIFDNGTTRPENACFCKGECIPSGVFNISACRQDSPTFLSFPHFYAADPYYSNLMKGMKPNRKDHEFYITLEPKSGIIMEIGARMQLNMLLQPVRHISLYQDVPKVFIPMFYFSQTVDLTDKLANSLRLIQKMPEYLSYFCLILVILGGISIIWGLCSCFWCSKKTVKLTLNQKININTQYEEVPLNEKR